MQIINAKIVLEDSIFFGNLRASNEIIEYIGEEIKRDEPTVSADGAYLVPGFVDIHCHGGGGYDFMDATPSEMKKISEFHLSHGTTTLVATTMTDRYEQIYRALDNFSALGEDRLTLHGVHLEGPWLNPLQCGAQDVSKMSLPSVEKLKEIIEKYPFVERISIAPELDTDYAVTRAAREAGLVVSAAHTDADFDCMTEAAGEGVTLITHLYSGMKGVTRKNAYRTAGCVEAGLYDDRIFTEVIADGKHLPKGLLQLIYKCKGADKICLITDAMRGAGMPDGVTTMLGRMNDGVPCVIDDSVAKTTDCQAFAGSVATADRLLRTMCHLAEIPLVDAVKMLTKTPASVMGYNDRGSISVGKVADLVLLNENLEINKIFLKGVEK
ncbi:MAG: N-acetylglucosamine-6-phosphate deacetylase [Clostridia bacterium]|nr:N-acetylglucosamine-6-phosphate deacetylase [Clostridia bacterium]